MNQNNNLPNDLNVALRVEDYYDYKAEVVETNSKDKMHIAMIKNVDQVNELSYHTCIYRDIGGVIIIYNQRFDTMFGALVIYKKLKEALEQGNIQNYWEYIVDTSKRDKTI